MRLCVQFLPVLLVALTGAGNAFALQAGHTGHACLVAEIDPLIATFTSYTQAHNDDEDEHYRIVLRYHILRRSDGSGGWNQLDLIDEHVRHVNWGFRDSPLVFVREPGVTYIDNDDYYSLQTVFDAQAMFGDLQTRGVANIFIANGTLFNNPNARAYTSPTPLQRGHIYGDNRIGLPANLAYSPHEIGHLLFLYHPYESSTNGLECVARTNCTNRGDLVCVTPASPVVFGGNTLRTGEYFGNSQGPCVGDPAYAPLTDNWMEAGWQYGDSGALIRNNFTPGQIERMVNYVRIRAADLLGDDRPDILVDCDMDGMDDIDEILAGDEADINEDKIPDQCQNFLRTGDLLVSGMNGLDTNTPRFFNRATGRWRGSLRTGASWAHQVRQGPDGLIYMPSLAVIQQLDPATGHLVKNLVDGGPNGASTFVDILFDANGDLLVLDNIRNDIKRYDRESGAYLGQFANLPTSSPKYMEHGPDGNIYVVGNGAGGNRVIRLDATTGDYMDDFVAADSGGLAAGQGLVFHGDHLYVSDGPSGQVLRYDAMTGAFDNVFVSSNDNGGLNNPHSLRFGPDGHLYVASRGNHSVKRYEGSSGAYVDDFVTAGSGGPRGTGTIDNPAGLLFASIEMNIAMDINAGMSGAWTNLETLGQGMFLDVIPDDQRIFMGWFTYEAGIEPSADTGNENNRWMVAIGPYEGDTATLELISVDGGTLNGPDMVTETTVGTATLRTTSCTEAAFEYELEAGLSGAMTLNRLLPDALCGQLAQTNEQ